MVESVISGRTVSGGENLGVVAEIGNAEGTLR